MINKKILSLIAICLIGTVSVYATEAFPNLQQLIKPQMPEGWFIGTNLKEGDFFSYNICHIYYIYS